jgi:putative FmdB family regulatory protein
MPIYDYACEKCEREFEVEQRITEEPLKTCPKCKSRKVKRLISQTSFVLKGGGWYSDLYSSSKGEKADKSDKSDKSDKTDTDKPSTSDSSEKKTEKKSDGKSDSKKKKGKAAAA